MITFVSESFQGKLKQIPPGLEKLGVIPVEHSTLTLQGNKYAPIPESVKSQTIVVGTDLDQQGTKVASYWKYQAEGKDVIRMSATNKGYVKVGGFYSKERLQSLLKADAFNKKVYEKLSQKGIHAGYRSAVVIGAVARAKEKLKGSVPVKRQGTNTITYLVKSALNGVPVEKAMQNLIKKYHAGEIAYPRVDNDYHTRENLDLFAHPSLPEFDRHSTPFETDEIPLNKETVLLYLNDEGLVSPATALHYYRKIGEYYDDDLSIKPGKEKEVSLLKRVAEAFEDVYKKENYIECNPTLKMEIVPTPKLYDEKAKKEEVEEELERIKEAQRRLAEREEYLQLLRQIEKEREEVVQTIEREGEVFREIKQAYQEVWEIGGR